MDLAIKTKMPVSDTGLPSWNVIESEPSTRDDFSSSQIQGSPTLHDVAEQIKNSVKAKYKDNWLTIATQLNNNIRENQKQALISYLLTLQLPSPDGMGAVTDADGLFEYLLIDVQMTSLVVTSRLIQATLAVQLFVDRCFLSLESQVQPDSTTHLLSIDANEWEWMKHYSIYAGLKKIPVYLENYLDPSLRDDKSEFFLDFEAEIKKGDITDENAENAFRNYVNKLDEVAHVDVCGFYEDTDTDTIYVFASTRSHPPKYFFRTRDKQSHWQPWQQVELDIKQVNNTHNKDLDKANGTIGVHLIPVVWNKRLFLFWPEFTQKSIARKSGASSFQDAANTESPDNSGPQQYWQINLAWSEYVNKKWVPKKLSKDFLKPLYFDDAEEDNIDLLLVDPSHFFWTTRQNIQDKSLSINLYLNNFLFITSPYKLGSFSIQDPQQQIIGNYSSNPPSTNPQYKVTFKSFSVPQNYSYSPYPYTITIG
jgi:hypothetical protein